jgi:hypothetical protein
MHTVLRLELLRFGNRDKQTRTMLQLDLTRIVKAMEMPIMLRPELFRIVKVMETSITLRLDLIQIVKAIETPTTLRLLLTQINKAMTVTTMRRPERFLVDEVTTASLIATQCRQSPPPIPTLRPPEMSAHCPLRHITTTDSTINSHPALTAVRERQIPRLHAMTNLRPANTAVRGQRTMRRPRVTTNLHPACMEARGRRVIRHPRTQYTTRRQ